MKISKSTSMLNNQSPEKRQIHQTVANFAKFLQLNEQKCYDLIPLMLKGESKTSKGYSDFVFSHLRNIFQNQVNSKPLKGAAKVLREVSQFLTVLILIGNLHIYQNLIEYLLPFFTEIIQIPSKTVKTLWPLTSFCKQIVILLSTWLPFDFFQKTQPSIFCKLVKQLRINCDKFQYFNIAKLIASYRVIKSLGLDAFDQKCICEHCCTKQSLKKDQRYEPFSNDKRTHKMREKLYIIQAKQHPNQSSWLTGFEIQQGQEVKQLSNLLCSKLSYFNKDLEQSYLYYPLRQKIDLLQDHISGIKKDYSELHQEQQVKTKNQQIGTPNQSKKMLSKKETKFETTQKKNELHFVSQAYSAKLLDQNSQDFQLLLNSQFKGENCSFFSLISLNNDQLKSFKLSLLKFNQKVYIKKSEFYKIYCISACKNQTLKIRVYFQGGENEQNESEVKLIKNKSHYALDFCQQKYEFTLNFYDFVQPIQFFFKSPQQQYVFNFSFGFIKLMTILSFRVEEHHEFNFKFTKTLKLMNPLIPNYETLVQMLFKLQSFDKNPGRSIVRTLLKQKMKGKYERRCTLLGSEFLLIIKNNKTQYIDIEIWCEKISKNIRMCCKVLNQFIYINS